LYLFLLFDFFGGGADVLTVGGVALTGQPATVGEHLEWWPPEPWRAPWFGQELDLLQLEIVADLRNVGNICCRLRRAVM
jgi:hypothetical protein